MPFWLFPQTHYFQYSRCINHHLKFQCIRYTKIQFNAKRLWNPEHLMLVETTHPGLSMNSDLVGNAAQSQPPSDNNPVISTKP